MTIKIGDKVPFVTLHHMTGEGPAEIAARKSVVEGESVDVGAGRISTT